MLGSGLVRTKVKTGRDFRRNDTPPNYPARQVSVKRVPFSSRCPRPECSAATFLGAPEPGLNTAKLCVAKGIG